MNSCFSKFYIYLCVDSGGSRILERRALSMQGSLQVVPLLVDNWRRPETDQFCLSDV